MDKKITLVDDDQNITTSLKIALENENFIVNTFNDGESALHGILSNIPDLVLLDIKMPRMTGTEVLTKLREKSNVPVIFLTSVDDEVDQVIGLRLGADDYITKPFSQRLLIERIKAVLRRNAQADEKNESNKDKIVHGDLTLDNDRYACFWNSEALNLTVTEYLLLQCLVIKPGHVKTRDQLITHAYGETIHVDDRTIDSHIKRVRKKFKQADPEFDQIETLYGIGYRYKEN